MVNTNVSGMWAGVAEVSAPEVTSAPAGGWGVTGLWRPAGVLDRWRLRHAPIVARAHVRSDDALPIGAIVVLSTADEANSDLWLRVIACTPGEVGFALTLGLLGEP